MTACHCMMSLSSGAPFTPSGGSDCILLKSRINRRRAAVDMAAMGASKGLRARLRRGWICSRRQHNLSTPAANLGQLNASAHTARGLAVSKEAGAEEKACSPSTDLHPVGL